LNLEPKTYYSNGKLLITGEYLVLDGARTLALPTKYGQSLKVIPNHKSKLRWKSFNEKDVCWFESEFFLELDGKIASENNSDISNRLVQILNAAKDLNPNFLLDAIGFDVESHLEFPRNWGLGSSSTLIQNLAQWANVNPYDLLNMTFGGSGYDIACASHQGPLTYKLINQDKRVISSVNFKPVFSEQLYFLHLNQKQNSREGIAQYRANTADKSKLIKEVNQITSAMINCETLSEFQKLMNAHETLISGIIKQDRVEQKLFSDFEGGIKSLGAWGGDFVMVAHKTDPTDYFRLKGYETVIRYEDMVI